MILIQHNVIVLKSETVIFFQLYRASALFETIRHEAQHSTDYKLSLFDLQTSCYQALQRVLVSLGKTTFISLCFLGSSCLISVRFVFLYP